MRKNEELHLMTAMLPRRSVWGIICILSFLLSVAASATADTHTMTKTCTTLCRGLPGLTPAECQKSGLEPSGAFSNNGFPILIKEYPPVRSRKPQARILVIGGTHGDEPASVFTVLNWMQKLDKYHSGLFHWKVVPLLNPDGLLKKKPTRTNARGVDLNRNMPSPLGGRGVYQRWADKTDRDTRQFPGLKPAGEPESKWLVKLIQEFKPQAIISVHAPLNIVDFDGPGPAPTQLGRLRLRRLGNFPGTLGNYAGEVLGVPVVTLELPSDSTPPSSAELNAIWTDLVRWLKAGIPVSHPDSAPARKVTSQGVAAE
ncbi:MAG: succinylglutamate desuccinylase/aspartoacylase family protein [Deltaproteobacteria bacterium]|nr:succinylglutamate desuccinylase/aspartoacylase family protein [Deltaproteobacteria bacterium]